MPVPLLAALKPSTFTFTFRALWWGTIFCMCYCAQAVQMRLQQRSNLCSCALECTMNASNICSSSITITFLPAPPACRQHFAPEVVRQLDAPLAFVDFLREPATDAETGEVLDAHPSFYESVPGGLPELSVRARMHACALLAALIGMLSSPSMVTIFGNLPKLRCAHSAPARGFELHAIVQRTACIAGPSPAWVLFEHCELTFPSPCMPR